MARWRLTQPHYLNTPGTRWEYVETDRKTGRPIRKQFVVPLLVDPNDPTQWTTKDGDLGQVEVCHEGKGLGTDLVFEGLPTPDMIPLDDEAKALSAECAAKWRHPIETLPSDGAYADTLIQQFQEEMSKVQLGNATPATVQVEGLSDMMKAMTELTKQNAAILAALASAPATAKRSL